MKELYIFFKKPSLQIENYFSSENKLILFLKTVIYLFAFAITSVILMKIIDSIVFYTCHFSFLETIKRQNDKYFVANDFWRNCFYSAFLMPFIEEVIFRFPLNLKKWNVAIGVSMLSFMFIGDKVFRMNIYNFNTWIKFGVVFFILMIFYFLEQKYFDIIKNKYYGICFYSFCLSFGLIHIFNFIHLIPDKLVFLVPFFVLPQIILGFFAGYIRIKSGFFWGVLIHIFFNLPITLLHILTHK